MTRYVDPGEQQARPARRKPKNQNNGCYGVASLWDAPAPCVMRPTSEDAADAQSVPKRDVDRLRILKCLAAVPDGLTRDQLAARLAISPNTVRPRIVELVTLGCVHDDRITRLTATGSPAAVCEITERGLAYLNGTN